jgi:regulator of sigma E protease
MDILAVNFEALWGEWIWPVLLLVIGLGLVVFVHELGHFIFAKGVGIKVERFALGFGPRLFGFKAGETDYCVKLLPLGGYVKMLGQEDFRPLKATDRPDPRSYEAKPVWARLLVVSAGVINNVIFAALLFVVVCLIGIRFTAPRVGGVMPGYPADEAKITWLNPPPGVAPTAEGLKPGDLFRKINDRRVTNFQRLQVTAALADKGEVFVMEIEREIDGRPVAGIAEVGVKGLQTDRGGERFVFGISPAADVVFADAGEDISDSPFRPGDTVLSVNGRPVTYAWDIEAVEKDLLPDGPEEALPASVKVTVERDGQQPTFEVPVSLRLARVLFHKGRRLRVRSAEHDEETHLVHIRLPDGRELRAPREEVVFAGDVLVSFLGMVPRLCVASVQEGSPADDAGLRPGDAVVSYADSSGITFRRLLDINKEHAGRSTVIIVERAGQRRQLLVTPKYRNGRALVGMVTRADLASGVVGAVREGSPAAAAGVQPGDAVSEVLSRDASGEPVSYPLKSWIDVFNALVALEGRAVTVKFASGRALEVPRLTPALFDRSAYRAALGVAKDFEPLRGPEVRKNPLAAIGWGARETADFIVMTYAMLRSWLKGNISHKEFAGPVGIGDLAIRVGRRSVVDFIYFMAIISISLAVVNFLPLPVVDGGLAVFLIIEKVRGKPVPTKIMNIVQMAGLAMLVVVFIALTWNDISRILSGLW